ncbi:RibD family protein [Aquabacterium sp.]|uniref:RibD family protein n=1 Tax=Aquabacterium sp. TaxID=1872578 RepID=UPI003D6D1DD3
MDDEALWTFCLGIAEARRAGRPPSPPSDGLAWSDASGWRLIGPWSDASRQFFDLFKPLLDRHAGNPPWVIAQLGQSLDGCVATRTGDSCFINGPENLAHLHRLRALCDAVIVGAGTVVADDPRLTTRLVSGPCPTRVLLDPSLRLAEQVAHTTVFKDGQAPTLWLCDERWHERATALVGASAVLSVPGLLQADGSPRLPAAIQALQSHGLKLLFVEGGGVTVSRFMTQGCLDRLHLAVAPLIIGNGRPGLSFTGPDRLADCVRPPCRLHPMGPDQLWDLDLRPAAG